MRLWRLPVAAATLIICATVFFPPSPAHAQTTAVGNWQVVVDQDPFLKRPRVVAVTGSGPVRMALQCNAGKLTIELGNIGVRGPFLTGERVAIEFRADRRPIVEAEGLAINDARVQIETATEMARQMLDAKEVAFRITKPRSWPDLIYPLLKTERALVPLISACPMR